jgi:hypothetical protein
LHFAKNSASGTAPGGRKTGRFVIAFAGFAPAKLITADKIRKRRLETPIHPGFIKTSPFISILQRFRLKGTQGRCNPF